MSKEETEGMVDPKEYSEKEQKQPDSNYKLWKLLEEIRDAIKSNTTAMNNLCTAAFMNRNSNVTFSNVPEQPQRPMPEKTEPHPLISQKAEPLPERNTKTENPIEKVQTLFEQSIVDLLDFTMEGDKIKIKPRQFLGSDNFAKIAATVRQAGGEYVSAGKGSHFKVPI